MADFSSTESNNVQQKFMLADMAASLNRPVVKIAKVNADLLAQPNMLPTKIFIRPISHSDFVTNKLHIVNSAVNGLLSEMW